MAEAQARARCGVTRHVAHRRHTVIGDLMALQQAQMATPPYINVLRLRCPPSYLPHPSTSTSTSTSAIPSSSSLFSFPRSHPPIHSFPSRLEHRHGSSTFPVLSTPAPRCPTHLRRPTSPLRADSRWERVHPQGHAYVANKPPLSPRTDVCPTGGRLPQHLKGIVIANAIYYGILTIAALVG